MNTDFDTELGEFLAATPRAHQFLTGIADILDNQSALVITQGMLAEAVAIAQAYTLGGLPTAIADRAIADAFAELPELSPNETAGAYAARVRASATDLR